MNNTELVKGISNMGNPDSLWSTILWSEYGDMSKCVQTSAYTLKMLFEWLPKMSQNEKTPKKTKTTEKSEMGEMKK